MFFFSFDSVNKSYFKKIISNFKDCSPGMVEISMKVMKYCINRSIKPNKYVCNLSLLTGVFLNTFEFFRYPFVP